MPVSSSYVTVAPHAGTPSVEPPIKGGLAAWQQRAVTAYIEEHLAEPILLANSRPFGGP